MKMGKTNQMSLPRESSPEFELRELERSSQRGENKKGTLHDDAFVKAILKKASVSKLEELLREGTLVLE